MMTIIIWILSILAFLSSIRYAIIGDKKIEDEIVDILSHGIWSFFVFLVLFPINITQIARGWSSPIPWINFMQNYSKHGIDSGILSVISLLTVELWIFWIPGNIYIYLNPDIKKEHKFKIRIINIIGGLLLSLPNSPVYKILSIVSGK